MLQDVGLYQPPFFSRIFSTDQSITFPCSFTLYNCSLTKYLLISFFLPVSLLSINS